MEKMCWNFRCAGAFVITVQINVRPRRKNWELNQKTSYNVLKLSLFDQTGRLAMQPSA